jgi:CPA2 family monovalent cation:H+ antiporter-2
VEAHPSFFRDFAYVFIAATAGGILAWRLRQPLIIGYVLAGALISPLTPGPKVEDAETLELFAEIGVILLMFSVGLEFSLRDLLRAKWVAIAGGSIGILVSILLGIAAGHWLGMPVNQGVVIGAIVCVASTMVMTRLLMDRGELRTEHGLVMVSITLVEDIAVVVLVVLIPTFGSFQPSTILSVAKGLGRAALILLPAFFIAAKVIPPVMARVARMHSRELFFVVVLAIGFGTAALTQAVGLSLALGAFVAGLIISGSHFAHEALAELLSVRDAFVALFFVTIGLLVNPQTLFSNPMLLAVMLLLIVVGKFVIWLAVILAFRYSIRTAVSAAVGLTQIGEFSFIIVKTAQSAGLVGEDIYNGTLVASLISILSNAALLRVVPAWTRKLREPRNISAAQAARRLDEQLRDHVVLCGFGRVGSAVGLALEAVRIPFVVIERDPDVATAIQSRNVPYLFGDATHAHLLGEARIGRSSLVIVTLPESDAAAVAVRNIRKINPAVPVLVRATRPEDMPFLQASGATEIVQPESVASAKMLQFAFKLLGIPKDRIATYLEKFESALTEQENPVFPYLEVRQLNVNGPPLSGQDLRQARIRERFGVTVVSIRRPSGEVFVNPPADTILRAGDSLHVFGLPQQIDRLASELAAQQIGQRPPSRTL